MVSVVLANTDLVPLLTGVITHTSTSALTSARTTSTNICTPSYT